MSVLKTYFDYGLSQASPVVDDYCRVLRYDEKGSELVSYEKFDYPKYQQSLGTDDFWSLESLLKAGINPNFSIHTGNPTRLEGVSTVESFVNEFDKVLSEEPES